MTKRNWVEITLVMIGIIFMDCRSSQRQAHCAPGLAAEVSLKTCTSVITPVEGTDAIVLSAPPGDTSCGPYAPYAWCCGTEPYMHWQGSLMWLRGDLTLDGIVDAKDLQEFGKYVTGPGIPWSIDIRWTEGHWPIHMADLDKDGDVDQDDFGVLQRLVGGVT